MGGGNSLMSPFPSSPLEGRAYADTLLLEAGSLIGPC
jgi:hypothetical protein